MSVNRFISSPLGLPDPGSPDFNQALLIVLEEYLRDIFQDLETETVRRVQSGTATLVAGTVAVVFTYPMGTTSYQVVTGSDTSGETYAISLKASTGFTITSSNGASTANVDWLARADFS